MSAEGREYLRHLIVDKPFGTAVPDLAEERARQDGIMFGFLGPMRERYAVAIAEDRIGGIRGRCRYPGSRYCARECQPGADQRPRRRFRDGRSLCVVGRVECRSPR